jgi:hypothetical protein
MLAFKLCITAAALIAFGAAAREARAQDLDAGKTPPQLFSSTCTACHRGPQGLAQGRNAGAVATFLRQHYTTGPRTASELAGYLVAVGGEAPRGAAQREPVRGEPAKKERQPAARERAEAAQAARDARLRRARARDEPATVATDPEPVVVEVEPKVLTHERALSAAHEKRDWAAFAASLAPPPPVAPSEPAPAAPAGPEPTIAAATQLAARGAGMNMPPVMALDWEGPISAYDTPQVSAEPRQSTATIQPFAGALP